MRRFLIPLLLVSVAVSCAPTQERFETPDVEGPAAIQMDVVLAHARSFDEDVPERTAGSQQEQAAASYITGTLQQNGYFVRLEAVPIGDLVRSTNVIAEPAGAEEPEAVVVVPYDVGPDEPVGGENLGLFLELARALTVEEPGHNVYFVALGAEHASEEGGHLGSRRLAQFMLDEGWDPLVVQPLKVSKGLPLSIAGDRADDVVAMMSASSGPFVDFQQDSRLMIDPDVFKSAGFDRLLIQGDTEKIGIVLMDFLRLYTD